MHPISCRKPAKSEAGAESVLCSPSWTVSISAVLRSISQALSSGWMLLAISILGVLLRTSTAKGQTTSAADIGTSTGGTQLGEVIVTARKTAERLQDIPMSVAVITADAIEKTGATTLEDLGRETPGLNIVSAAPGQNQIILRGLSGNNTVGFYLDHTPLAIGIGNAVQPNNFDMDPALFDLNRVEVLRGPQGSLYGASSFGGTVRYITNQPNLNEEQVTAKVTGSGTH